MSHKRNMMELVERIITVNHAWKLSREEFGAPSAITKSLRDVKSSLQSSLLRDYPNDTYLYLDSENSSEDDILFSVRLKEPLTLAHGVRMDAEHLPKRIAVELFTEDEITQLLNR